MLLCVAVCCSVLQWATLTRNVLRLKPKPHTPNPNPLYKCAAINSQLKEKPGNLEATQLKFVTTFQGDLANSNGAAKVEIL